MPKKPARTKTKVTKKTTKGVKVTKSAKKDLSFTLVKKQDNYLPFLIVLLFASLIFLGLVLSLR